MGFPPVLGLSKVGEYAAVAKAGGRFVWDAVPEYRVWCRPEKGAPDEADASDYYYAFESYEEAEAFARANDGTEEPLAPVLQRECSVTADTAVRLERYFGSEAQGWLNLQSV